MRFASRTYDGPAVMVDRRKRRRAMNRDRGGKLAVRDYAMHLLATEHGFMLRDLADTFSLSERQVRRALESMEEGLDRVAS